MLKEFMVGRKPTADEGRLLLELARIAGIAAPENWLGELMVREMKDAGMGSLEFVVATRGDARSGRVKVKAALQFADEDGVQVIATLYSDERGEPCELDIWKTDFSPLRRIPCRFRHLEE